MKSIIEYLKESLHNHVDYNFSDYTKFYYVFEKNGIPEEIRNLIDEIDIKYDNLEYNESANFYNDKFIKITTITKLKGDPIAEYDIEKTDYINRHVFINIYDNEKSKLNTIRNFIRHELVHAYEDIKRYEHGKELFSDIIDDQYRNSSLIVANRSQKQQYNQIADILYFLHDEERNAYFSGLESDIIEAIDHYNMNDTNFNYDKLIEYVKDKPLWKKYFEIGIFIEQLINNKLQGYYKEFVYKEYNNINNSNLSEYRINKDIVNKWIKFKNKFEQLVPKIICNSLPYENKAR